MRTEFHYCGYIGSAEVDAENYVLVGKLLYIQDTITYSAKDAEGLEQAFREAVDEYLAACEKLGDAPEVPFKGSFNVRVGEQRHRDSVVMANRLGISLNDFVCRAIDEVVVSGPVLRSPLIFIETHSLKSSGEKRGVGVLVSTKDEPDTWKKSSIVWGSSYESNTSH